MNEVALIVMYLYLSIGMFCAYQCLILISPTEEQLENLKKLPEWPQMREYLEPAWTQVEAYPIIKLAVLVLAIILWLPAIFIIMTGGDKNG